MDYQREKWSLDSIIMINKHLFSILIIQKCIYFLNSLFSILYKNNALCSQIKK